jgi:hypothetical protein
MPWFRVDDNLAFHPKAVEAGNAALGLWVRAGSWSMQYLTDGQVPATVVADLGTERQTEKLVSSGFWVPEKDFFVFHQWNDRQPNSETIRAQREATQKRVRQWRQGKTGKDH